MHSTKMKKSNVSSTQSTKNSNDKYDSDANQIVEKIEEDPTDITQFSVSDQLLDSSQIGDSLILNEIFERI